MGRYVKPLYQAADVNRASRAVAEAIMKDEVPDKVALQVVNNWRAAHEFPLNGVHMTLRLRAKKVVNGNVLSAQRIKRMESIVLKLKDRPNMKLTQMQDIGGCRVILPTVHDVRTLQKLYEESPIRHDGFGPKDYIAEPVGDSGYRSLHLKFKFCGRGPSEAWDGLKIEMQLRTMLQHRWATAVEAAGTMTGQLLKSRRGDEQWRRFFLLSSALFAFKENTTPVPTAPSTYAEVVAELRDLEGEYKVLTAMQDYSLVVQEIHDKLSSEHPNAHSFVIKLTPADRSIRVWEYERSEMQAANDLMEKLEAEADETEQVVRVSVSSLANLKKAYPNYFLDTTEFVRELRITLNA